MLFFIITCVKASTVGYCLACSKCRVLWEIRGSENSNLRFIGLMPCVFWDLGIAVCSVCLPETLCVCVCVCMLCFCSAEHVPTSSGSSQTTFFQFICVRKSHNKHKQACSGLQCLFQLRVFYFLWFNVLAQIFCFQRLWWCRCFKMPQSFCGFELLWIDLRIITVFWLFILVTIFSFSSFWVSS